MNSDFKAPLLEALKKHKVRFLIVDGYALVEYTEPQFTKDLDLRMGATKENGVKAHAALTDVGAPLFGATPEDLATGGNVLHIGVPPCRVDVLTSIDGVDFETAWPRRVAADFDGVNVDIKAEGELQRVKESRRSSTRWRPNCAGWLLFNYQCGMT